MTAFIESIVEDATLAWLEALGYGMLPGAERSDPNYRDVAPKTLISGELRVKVHSGLAEAPA